MIISPYLIYGVIGLLIVFLFIIWNLFRKYERLEELNYDLQELNNTLSDFITYFGLKIKESQKKIKDVDSKGHFESDDEVGYFFKMLVEIQSELDDFIPENIKN